MKSSADICSKAASAGITHFAIMQHIYPISRSTTMHVQPHTLCITEQGLGLVVIGSVNRNYQFTYLPGEEENSWPGGLWNGETLPLFHV